MTTQNKVIIALLALIVIIVVVWLVQNYQTTEKKYQACLGQCAWKYPVPPDSNMLTKTLGTKQFIICKAECKEKYGK